MRFLHNLVGTYTKSSCGSSRVVLTLNRTEIGNFVSDNHVRRKPKMKTIFLHFTKRIDEKRRLRQVTTDLGLTITQLIYPLRKGKNKKQQKTTFRRKYFFYPRSNITRLLYASHLVFFIIIFC